jgi:hypothetical protein
MKNTKILYWVLAGIFAFSILGGAIPSALSLNYAVEHFTKVLGYPAYFLPFTGIAKLLGLVGLFIPGYPRIKEWVYAGFVYDLTGAVYSSLCIGGTVNYWFPLFFTLVLLIGSYICYHKILNNKEEMNSNLVLTT